MYFTRVTLRFNCYYFNDITCSRLLELALRPYSYYGASSLLFLLRILVAFLSTPMVVVRDMVILLVVVFAWSRVPSLYNGPIKSQLEKLDNICFVLPLVTLTRTWGWHYLHQH